MKCPDCNKLMQWNKDVNGYVCPHGCFAVYEMTRGKVPAGQADACIPEIDYLEMVNGAIKEKLYGY
jgi:hypothetical protein